MSDIYLIVPARIRGADSVAQIFAREPKQTELVHVTGP
jgi:hypothetical protein